MSRKELYAARRDLKTAVSMARLREVVLSWASVPKRIILEDGTAMEGENARHWYPYLLLAAGLRW